MLFFKAQAVPPVSKGRLLIAEYVTLTAQAEIPVVVDSVAELLSSASDDLNGYALRSVGRSVSGDLRTVAFVWDAASTEVAAKAGRVAKGGLAAIQDLLLDVEVHFLTPTKYDHGAKSPSAKVLASVLKQKRAGAKREEPVIECGLHDNISLMAGALPKFLDKAGPLIPTFEEQTNWKFSGAGTPIDGGDRVMHFWRMASLGTVPEAMTTLSDIPAYGQIQDLILTENQNFFMQARSDLPVGFLKKLGVSAE